MKWIEPARTISVRSGGKLINDQIND